MTASYLNVDFHRLFFISPIPSPRSPEKAEGSRHVDLFPAELEFKDLTPALL